MRLKYSDHWNFDNTDKFILIDLIKYEFMNKINLFKPDKYIGFKTLIKTLDEHYKSKELTTINFKT